MNAHTTHPSLPPTNGFERTGHYRSMARAIGPFAAAKELIRVGTTPAQVDELLRHGRIDGTTGRWLQLAAEWTAPRMSAHAQYRLWARLGQAAVDRRIARIRRLFGMPG